MKLESSGSGGPAGTAEISSYELPKYLSLEPCAKETAEQFAEVENAKDAEEQVAILTGRLEDKNEWTRGCAIYRLGMFSKSSSSALPALIKIIRDDNADGVFSVAIDAIYKIPPPPSLRLKDLRQMVNSANVYTRLHAVWALGYFRYISGSGELKETVDDLILATKDDDATIRWIAVEGIRRIGFDARAAIPALIDLIQKKNTNPKHIVYALGRMGPYMLPAVPALFDILYHTEKYETGDVGRSVLYSTTAIILARLGKDIIPLLEKEFDKQPYAVLEIAQNISDGDISSLIIKGYKHRNKEVRKKALGLFHYNFETSIKLLQPTMALLNDLDPEVRQQALSMIGRIVDYRKDSPELAKSLKEKALPALFKMLKDKDKQIVCYTAFAIGDFGAEAETAVPVLVRFMKQRNSYPNNCAENALFKIGEKGRKFLSKEKIEQLEKSEASFKKIFEDGDREKTKPIAPKPAPEPKKIPDSY